MHEWTVERIIAELASLGPLEQLEPLIDLSGETEALHHALWQALDRCDGLAQLNAAAMLLRLQDRAGRDVFLAALGSQDAALQKSALEFLQFDLVPHDTHYEGRPQDRIKVPVSGAEIFPVIAPLLRDPQSDLGNLALHICLFNDIEAARPTTRRLLAYASGTLRLKVAKWYLKHGHDDGALRVMEQLFEAAPSRPDSNDPRWYDLRASWSSIHDCCRTATEPLRTQVTGMAMRIVRTVLDAPGAGYRTHINTGFVDIGEAAKAIACVMPDGAQALLEQIIAAAEIDDYGRGQAIIALARAGGARSRHLVRSHLANATIREYAAAAVGEIAKGSNDPADIEALASALSTEDRPGVVSAILIALAGIGPDARTHVQTALARAAPWDRMKLSWQLAGWSNRQIADMLREAGAIEEISDVALAEAAGDNGLDLVGLIWTARRLAYMNVKSDDVSHDALFGALLAIARPKVSVEGLSQTCSDNYLREPVPNRPGIVKVTDLGNINTIRFAYDGQEHSFTARPIGRWLDVAAVVAGFDAFMAAIGREDRCFQLLSADSSALFVVAPEAKFRALAERLRIPLESDPDEIRRRGIAYVRRVVDGA